LLAETAGPSRNPGFHRGAWQAWSASAAESKAAKHRFHREDRHDHSPRAEGLTLNGFNANCGVGQITAAIVVGDICGDRPLTVAGTIGCRVKQIARKSLILSV
jgi:hypothetical protein